MNMARVTVFIIIVVILGYAHVSQVNSKEASFMQSTKDMFALAEAEDLAIQEWRIQVRGEQGFIASVKEFHQHVHNLSEQLTGWEMKETVDSDANWTAQIVHRDPKSAATESIRIYAYPVNGEQVLTHTYELTGLSEKNRDISQLEEFINNRLEYFNLSNAQIITELTARTETEQLLTTARRYLASLGAVEVEGLAEETFVSISAYNDEWGDVITIKDESQMNVQVALRQEQRLGLGTTVTIGTPIITTEY